MNRPQARPTPGLSWLRWVAPLALSLALVACHESDFDPRDPARGPGSAVGDGSTITDGNFPGGTDEIPAALDVEPPQGAEVPNCGADCLSFCESQGFENPVHQGLCTSLWGVGLEPQPVYANEACRRLHVDLTGRFPTRDEVNRLCAGKTWDDIVNTLLDSEAFVEVNQRYWADRFLYNTRALSIERIFDMDVLVGKLYRGEVAYDHFAAIASAHPVLTRRHDTAGDRAEALFHLFMGRPPLGSERSDLARLYTLWTNGYYDHPTLNMRLSDSFIRYRCVDEEGNVDPESRGQCTSILYGYNELILTPDIRSVGEDNQMWSGLLRADEWEKLQMPGRLLARQQAFWETAVDDVIERYLGYDLGTMVPEVRAALVDHLLAHDGDIRSVHHAILTSVAYLQSARGLTDTDHRWTFGPLKQVDSEVWLDTIKHSVDYELSSCDHRISDPRDLLDADSISAIALLESSKWEMRDDGEDVRRDYSDLARNLGGCPANEVGGRFKIVSILTTSTQLNFVNQVCNPAMAEGRGAAIEKLLPAGVHPDAAVTPQLATDIVEHQVATFFGRPLTDDEREMAATHGDTCERARCRAAEFARPGCFALLSSSEMLFY
ncbi:DUF1549 domain-containing protein [Lujinxingia vulgaris]|uniref:DUF1549 domain-containing protein n=1 Tax=Lujinxingia vulgaris TaxID=2600176 RepID=UPI001E4B0A56|nr:DUF1549 domain-containing protein [Lujinxingia vulgaris]